MVLDLRSRPSHRRRRWWRVRCVPMSRPASKPSERDVACLKATSRLTRKASATQSTGTPASCSRKMQAELKGLISSLELPRAFIGSMELADTPVGPVACRMPVCKKFREDDPYEHAHEIRQKCETVKR